MPQETTYNLTTPSGQPYVEDVAAKLAELVDNTPPGHPEHHANTDLWTDVLEGNDRIHWHTAEHDMARVSLSWPGTLFTLECLGESPEDLWRVHAKDGGYQVLKPEIRYPEPDFAAFRKP